MQKYSLSRRPPALRVGNWLWGGSLHFPTVFQVLYQGPSPKVRPSLLPGSQRPLHVPLWSLEQYSCADPGEAASRVSVVPRLPPTCQGDRQPRGREWRCSPLNRGSRGQREAQLRVLGGGEPGCGHPSTDSGLSPASPHPGSAAQEVQKAPVPGTSAPRDSLVTRCLQSATARLCPCAAPEPRVGVCGCHLLAAERVPADSSTNQSCGPRGKHPQGKKG